MLKVLLLKTLWNFGFYFVSELLREQRQFGAITATDSENSGEIGFSHTRRLCLITAGVAVSVSHNRALDSTRVTLLDLMVQNNQLIHSELLQFLLCSSDWLTLRKKGLNNKANKEK